MATSTGEAEARAHKSAEWADARARDADRAVKWLVIVFATVLTGISIIGTRNYYQMREIERHMEQAERDHERRLEELRNITRDVFANMEEEVVRSLENAFEGTAAQELDRVGAKLNRVEEALTEREGAEIADAEQLRGMILKALQQPEETESEP